MSQTTRVGYSQHGGVCHQNMNEFVTKNCFEQCCQKKNGRVTPRFAVCPLGKSCFFEAIGFGDHTTIIYSISRQVVGVEVFCRPCPGHFITSTTQRCWFAVLGPSVSLITIPVLRHRFVL